MIRNYFKTAFRSFQRDRSYALINILGLGMALAVFLLTLAYIRYELAFDRHLTRSEDLYRLVLEHIPTGKVTSIVPGPLGRTLTDVFPETEDFTQFSAFHSENVTYEANGKQQVFEDLRVDDRFFPFFDLPIRSGNLASLLGPREAAITQRVADAFFPDGDAIGQTIDRVFSSGYKMSLAVRLIIADIPAHTHFNGDILFRMSAAGSGGKAPALSFAAYSSSSQYLKLQPGTDVVSFTEKINRYLRNHHELSEERRVRLLPITDIHLRSSHIDRVAPKQHDIRFIYLFGFIALLILTIACINYINLSTARYLQKFKEIGMRKVLGADKLQLWALVFAESLLLFCIAIPIGTALAWLAWPLFGRLLDISDQIAYLIGTFNILLVVLTALLTALLASIYPAFLLIRRPAHQLFKQNPDDLQLSFSPRKVLIAFQFSITIILIVATLVVYSQLQMMSNRSMGFEKDYLLILRDTPNPAALKQRLQQIPAVTGISFAGSMEIGKESGTQSSMEDPENPNATWDFTFVEADFDFMETMQLELLQGRYFDPSYGSDVMPIDSLLLPHNMGTRPLIITESTAKELGVHKIDTLLWLGALQGRVVGIIGDFRMTSFRTRGPMVVLRPALELRGNAFIRIASHDIPKTLAAIERAWKDISPNSVFDYYFVDEKIQQLYRQEQNLAQLFSLFSVLAVTLSALGLFSLVALIVKHRTKEIGIRKVVGASVWDITRLFAGDFMAIMIVSILIAIPIAWWSMNKWLEDYAYRIAVDGWMLAAGALAAIGITLITVSWQTIRAALANPVKSLRDE